MRLHFPAALLLGVIACSALAHDSVIGEIRIADPWSRPTAEGMGMGVAYLALVNLGKQADTLVSASSPVAESVEIHETSLVDGMARMRPRAAIPLAPGATVKFEPGGLHLMLVGLKTPLVAGSTLPLTLVFKSAGAITVEVGIRNSREL